jgi:RNA polymerase sigma-70 factor (ECF subfamily)
MLGSAFEADDAVQETMVRAWKHLDTFEGRSSLRSWLYRIATNVCLTALESRSKRPLPTGLGAPATSPSAPLVEQNEVPWLEPVPDALVCAEETDPAAIVVSRSSVRLALVAALQHLPPRQRAVLILRDVLRWRAAEVAEALETSTVAVNSVLQRARAQLKDAGLTEDAVTEPTDPGQRDLLDRYARAMEAKDVATIVRLLKADALWEMPPFVGWYQGAEEIGRLIDVACPAGPGELRMLPTRANGQPAFAMYYLVDGVFQPFQLQVLEMDEQAIGHVTAFFDHALFPLFGLPGRLDADAPVAAGLG